MTGLGGHTCRMRPLIGIAALALLASVSQASPRNLYPGVDPGPASATRSGAIVTLENRALSVSWDWDAQPRAGIRFVNRLSGETTSLGEPCTLVFGDGQTLSLNAPLKDVVIKRIRPKAKTPRLADASSGIEAEADFGARHMVVHWRAILLDGSHYVRQEFTFKSQNGDEDVRQVRLIDALIPGAAVSGTVLGSPVVTASFFCGVEHPMSTSKLEAGRVVCSMARKLPLKEGVPVTYSSVYGVTPKGQLRRSFLAYTERERARPYAPFLHYNSWYDIGYFTIYKEADCLDSIRAFGEELVTKRGVKLASFLFDDGWDDHSTIWEFHKDLPKGFLPLKELAAKYGSAPGVWLSPWGGYGPPHDQRVAAAKAQGYETDRDGYALSGPKYYKRFHDVCLDLVGKYGINQFKLDGTGDPDKQFPGSPFASDFEAAIQLIGDLRQAKPELFINLTTGTWPSPFWTRYADSIWRGGDDHDFRGVGTKRQQWITYRDSDTYDGIVSQGPLYPLNSLMLHGLIYAQHAHDLTNDPGNDFRSEVRDYFGNGTQLQEMYITHKLLTPANWDDLAEAAKWSAANQDVLVDSHWIGGNPAKLEVYGWASWSPSKSILVLRNPSDKPQSANLDIALALEIPEGQRTRFTARSPWISDRAEKQFEIKGGERREFPLKPFEIKVLELNPRA